MKILILGENCLVKLRFFSKTIFSSFSFISSIHARQLAAITPKKHLVKVPEENQNIDYNEKWDVVLIHFRTGTALKAYYVADKFRKRNTIVVLSGAHPSALKKEAKCHADSVIIGSAENLWPIVIEDLEKNKLKPFYEINNNIIQNSFGISKINISTNNSLVGVIEATRGCPYQCDFCQDSNIPSGSIFRTRPIEEVIKEIRSFPQKFLFFCDVSLTIDIQYTKTLFRAMKGLNKKFVCEGNVDVLSTDEELLELSQEAGCIEWTVGFESFTQQVLNDINKKTNKIENFTRVVEKVHKYKMAVLGNFMFGFEHDTPDVFEITLEKINKLELDSARFAILTPYPGTPFFNKLESEGRILTRNWSKYNRKTVVFEPKNMSKEELKNGFIKISNNFNKISNIAKRNIRCLNLGFYPFLSSIGRNLESYMNRQK